MKRLFLLILFVAFLTLPLHSQIRYGVKGGVNLDAVTNVNIPFFFRSALSAETGFNAGLVLQMELPVRGMTIQPEVNYSSKRAVYGDDISNMQCIDAGYIEVPIRIQWGPKLGNVRPFIEASEYIAFAVYNNISDWKQTEPSTVLINALEHQFGVGFGAGVEFWKLQIVCRYSWNLNRILDVKGASLMQTFKDSRFRGLELSLGFLF